MPELFDVYTDQFLISSGAYGATLTYSRTPGTPSAPGSVAPAEQLGRVRMSLEHLKTTVYVLYRQVIDIEDGLQITIPISARTLNELKIAPEDWDRFWKRD